MGAMALLLAAGQSAHAQQLTVQGNSFLAASSGSVGIGTTSPQIKLQVQNGHVGAIGASNQFLELWYDQALIYGPGGCCGGLRFGHADNLNASGWVEQMKLTNDGRLGIGTSSPVAKLHVQGGTVASALAQNQFVELWADDAIIYGDSGGCCGGLRFGKASDLNASGFVEQLRLDLNGDIWMGGVDTLRRDGSNAHIFPWGTGYGSQTVYFGAGMGGTTVWARSFVQASSLRFKDHVTDTRYRLADVLKLNVKEYRYKGSNRPEVGLIAEEVVRVVPEVVSFDRDGKPDSIDYAKLSVLLIQGVKELKAENDGLRERLAVQNADVSRRLAALEKQVASPAGTGPVAEGMTTPLASLVFALVVLLYLAGQRIASRRRG
jgi:hypothetical protein